MALIPPDLYGTLGNAIDSALQPFTRGLGRSIGNLNALSGTYANRDNILTLPDLFTAHARQMLVHPTGVRLSSDQENLIAAIRYTLTVELMQPDGDDNRRITERYHMVVTRRTVEELSYENRLHGYLRMQIENAVDALRQRFEDQYNPPLTFQESRRRVRYDDDRWRWQHSYLEILQNQQEGLHRQASDEMQQRFEAYMARPLTDFGQQAAGMQQLHIAAQERLADYARQAIITPGQWFAIPGRSRADTKSERRAQSMLRELIGAEQLEVYKSTGNLYVVGKRYNYIIRVNGMLIKIDKKPSIIPHLAKNNAQFLCISIARAGNYPPTDKVIALKLMLEAREKDVLKQANRFERYCLPPNIQAACMERTEKNGTANKVTV